MSQAASTIYTRLGDDGSTGRLFGGRLPKDDAVVEACGDIDETVSALGVARAAVEDPGLAALVLRLQRELFVVAADLSAGPRSRDRLTPGLSLVTAEMTGGLEQTIDQLVSARPLRPVFVVPGSTPASAALDLARAVARRAERHVFTARARDPRVSPELVAYLNRLSDLLYVLARHAAGPDDEPASHE